MTAEEWDTHWYRVYEYEITAGVEHEIARIRADAQTVEHFGAWPEKAKSTTGDIVSRIEQAIGCQQCCGPLGDSPSADFCSQSCQEAWHSDRTDELIGYREPVDLAVHYSNLPELDLWSSEVVSTWRTSLAAVDMGPPYVHRMPTEVYFTVNVDTGPVVRAMAELGAALERAALSFQRLWEPATWSITLPDEPEPISCVPAEIDYEFDFPSTAVLLAEEPEAPRVRETVWDVEALQRLADRRPSVFTRPPAAERRQPVRSTR